MKLISKKRKYLEKGQVMLVVIVFFMSFALIISLGLINPIIKQFNLTSDIWKSKESYYVSESGIEDVIFRIKNNMTVGSSENLVLNGFDVDTSITSTLDGKVLITESDRNGYTKKIETKIKEGEGVSFNYGVQVGQGGFQINGGTIIGNVYSNGDITSDKSGSEITGSAISANSSSVFVDQSNFGSFPPTNSIIFGDTNNTQDLAQSFKVSSTSVITKLGLFLKKNDDPSDISVKIVKDKLGSPSPDSVDLLSSGLLNASLITTNYGWIDVFLSPNISLDKDSIYWIVLDMSKYSANKNYVIGATLDSSYLDGTVKIGKHGSGWSNSGYDSYFNIYLGGTFGKIAGLDSSKKIKIGSEDTDLAYAHIIEYTDISGDARCQIGIGNNKTCDTSYPDPSQISYPISDSNIEKWKEDAVSAGEEFGNRGISSDVSLGPIKINGNLDISGNGVLTVTGTIWVTGNVVIGGSGSIKLVSGYNANSGMIISDGKIILSGNGTINGSGQNGSYVLMITTSDCPLSPSCNNENAITVTGSGGAVILNAQKGTINFNGSADARGVTADKIIMTTGSRITYESGVANPNFSSGPSGGFNIESWRQLEQ